MRFLVDECTGPAVAQWLREQSHDVFSVYDDARGMTDKEVLEKAFSENRILITNDKDFGEMVFRCRESHHGIILLRLEQERTPRKIEALHRLLCSCANHLPNSFAVVTETQMRFAAAPGDVSL